MDYSVRQICETLGFTRSNLYYKPKKDPCEDVLRDEIEKLAAAYPTYGYRRITQVLVRQGYTVGHRRIARLMKSENLSVAVKRVCQTTKSTDGVRPFILFFNPDKVFCYIFKNTAFIKMCFRIKIGNQFNNKKVTSEYFINCRYIL